MAGNGNADVGIRDGCTVRYKVRGTWKEGKIGNFERKMRIVDVLCIVWE